MAHESDSRKVLFTMKTSPSERAQIRAAAEARGISAAEMIRRALRNEGALPAK